MKACCLFVRIVTYFDWWQRVIRNKFGNTALISLTSDPAQSKWLITIQLRIPVSCKYIWASAEAELAFALHAAAATGDPRSKKAFPSISCALPLCACVRLCVFVCGHTVLLSHCQFTSGAGQPCLAEQTLEENVSGQEWEWVEEIIRVQGGKWADDFPSVPSGATQQRTFSAARFSALPTLQERSTTHSTFLGDGASAHSSSIRISVSIRAQRLLSAAVHFHLSNFLLWRPLGPGPKFLHF